jgi:hypothetical protein
MPLSDDDRSPCVSLDLSQEQSFTLQDDVERLIGIAGQLFSAIERQIHSIEESLAVAYEEGGGAKGLTVLKEHLIQTALSLNQSLREISARLEERTERSSLLEHSHV